MKLLTVCALFLGVVVNGGYPPNFPKCKYADEACLVKAANDVIQQFPGGQADINLPPLDPFGIKSFHLEPNSKSPVNIDIKLKDVVLEGFKTMKVEKFQAFKADMSGRNTFSGIISSLKLKAHYTINGKILILPITGDGPAVLTCKNIVFDYSWDLKAVEKKGKTYATVEHVKLNFDPEYVHFLLDNLFNGDKALGETTNEFINKNWRELYNELREGLTRVLSLVVKSFINKFFEKQPYAAFFL